MLYDSGLYPDNNVVTAVNLIDPNGDDVDIGPLSFPGSYDIIIGAYGCDNSEINYTMDMAISDYNAVINDQLIQGTYTLQVTTDDAITYEKNYAFNQAVDLPYISSSTFEIRFDSSGNVFWTWDIPDALYTNIMSQNISVSSRAFIMVYDDQEMTAYFHVKVPSHMGHLFISSDKVQELMAKGNRFMYGVDVRSNDNNNRTYGSGLEVNNLLTTVSKKKKVVVIPMF
jgi:hypothetical protein